MAFCVCVVKPATPLLLKQLIFAVSLLYGGRFVMCKDPESESQAKSVADMEAKHAVKICDILRLCFVLHYPGQVATKKNHKQSSTQCTRNKTNFIFFRCEL